MEQPVTGQPPPDIPSFWRLLIQKLRLCRRRKHYLSDPKNQFRMMRQLLLIFGIGIGLGIVNIYIITYFMGMLDSSVGVFSSSNLFIYAIVLIYLASWMGISLAIFYTFMLVFSHRITGAANKLRQALDQLSEGDLGITVDLRRGDYLHELAAAINRAARTLRSWHTEMEEVMEELRISASTHQSLAEPLATAEQLLNRYPRGGPERCLHRAHDGAVGCGEPQMADVSEAGNRPSNGDSDGARVLEPSSPRCS